MIKFEDVKHITSKEYLNGEDYAADTFDEKYCYTKEDGSIETPAEVFWRVVSGLCDPEYREKTFSLLWEGWFRPGGSVLQGVHAVNKISLANCCTLPLEGDSLEDIAKCEYTVMKCAAFRQGIGIDFSNLRPRGTAINNAAQQSTGAIPWMKKVVSNGEVVGQRGRKPALLISLKDRHPDIFEFVLSKTEKGQIEDANISVQISDAFMEAVKNNDKWELRFDFDNGYESIVKEVNATDLFDIIANTAHSTAEPGVQYIDQLRKGSMVHQIYESTADERFKIISTNACQPGFADVLTPGGIRTFDNVNVDDTIWSGQRWTTIIKKWFTGIKPVYKYKTLAGSFVGTEDHRVVQHGKKIKVKNACAIDASYIPEDMNFSLKDPYPSRTYFILDIEYLGEFPVYDITVDAPEHTYWTDGLLVSNCSEKSLPAYSICNLSSINMEMFDPETYEEQLDDIVPLIVRLSDSVVSYELENDLSPLPEQKWILEQTREIGCGITNIHGWLLKQGLSYDSDEAIKKVEDFWKSYAYRVFKASADLGKEKGNAPAYDLVDKSDLMESTYFKNIVDEFYQGDYNIENMRNMAHLSIAPSGSISSTFPKPCVSSGIEPIIAPYYWRKTRIKDRSKYQYYFIIPNRIKEYLLSVIDKDSEGYKKLNDFSGSVLDEDGSIGKEYISIINSNLPKGFFKPAHKIDPVQKIKLLGKIYQWIDASISVTYNLPSTATVEDVKDIYLKTYKAGGRAVSVYVDGSRENILLTEFPKEKQDSICEENRPVSIIYNCAPKRPDVLPCDIHQISVKGNKWVVLVGLLYGKPFEIFCGPSEDIYLPQKCREGEIIKKGGGKYALKVKIRNSYVTYDDIANLLMESTERCITRMLSTGLRHGVYPQFIVDQMKKSSGDITDFATAISRVLSKYVIDYVMKDNNCPKCGEPSLTFMEGCMKCVNCNYTRCE